MEKRGGNWRPTSQADFLRLFWLQVERQGDCLVWIGTRSPSGYGQVTRFGVTLRAHRVALEDAGRPAPFVGAHAMHSCDNRACVNEAHLSWGTSQENEDDKRAKGRQAVGERVAGARLTREQVLELRQRYGAESLVDLAAEYGVGVTTIHRAATGRTWSWL